MELTLSKLVRSQGGLFLPELPKNEFLKIARAKIEEVTFRGLDDFLNAQGKQDFPFGLTLGLKINNANIYTGMRIPHPEDIVYFLDIANLTRLDQLNDKEVYVHYASHSKTYGITFPKQV